MTFGQVVHTCASSPSSIPGTGQRAVTLCGLKDRCRRDKS